MFSLAKAAKTSMRRIVRRDKAAKSPTAEAPSSNDSPKPFSRFKRSLGKGASSNHRLVTDASTTTIPMTTTTAPAVPAQSPRKGMRTAVNKIKQHVSDTLERLLTSLRGAQKNLSENVAKSVKLQQQAEQLDGFVEAAEAAAARAREQAATAAAAVGMLEHIEQQLLDKVAKLQRPLGGSSELKEIEKNLKVQHEAVLQQKMAVKQWYSNAAEAQAVQERATEVVGAAREQYEAAQRDLAAAAAALYEAQRATLAAKQMIMQAVCRAHLTDVLEATGEALEEEQLVLAERENDVVVVGHVSLAEKLRMEQGEIWEDIPEELVDVYGHTAVSVQRADYEQAKLDAAEATQQREAIAKLAQEVAALVDASAAPVCVVTRQVLQRQVDEETHHKEEAENRVKYLQTRLNWVRLAAARGAADDMPWISNTPLPEFEVDSDPSVLEAIEQLNIAKADLLAIERKLARLDTIAQLQASYAAVTGKNVAAGESVTVTATQLMKVAVLAEIRAFRNAKYAQQSVQEACEAVQLGMRQANGDQATPERSLSLIGLEPKRLQYFVQYYLEALPRRLSTRPRQTTPASNTARALSPSTPTVSPPSFTADPKTLSTSIPPVTPAAPPANGSTASSNGTLKPDADIARVRAALKGFLDKGQGAGPSAASSSKTPTSSSSPSSSSPPARISPSFDPVDFERPGRIGPSRERHPLAGTSLEVSASKTLQEAIQIDSSLLDSVRSRLALAALLERADNKVVRELVASQLAADPGVLATPTAVVEPPPSNLPMTNTQNGVDSGDSGADIPSEEALERIRHFYALQYMLERASNSASASSPTTSLSPPPVASFALSSISDDDSDNGSVASPRSSLDLTSDLSKQAPAPDAVSELSAISTVQVDEEEVIAQEVAPVDTVEEVAAVPEPAAISEEVLEPAAISEEVPEPVAIPEEVLVAAVQSPVVLESLTAVQAAPAEVPAPADMASALAAALADETTVSPAGNLVKKGPKKAKSAVGVKMKTLTLTKLPKFEITPPTWSEIGRMVQEKGELTGTLLALTIASWGGVVATHMDSVAAISTVYMAAGVVALSAVNQQTGVVAAREAALVAEREAALAAEREAVLAAEREAALAAEREAALAAEREAAERAAAEAAAVAAAQALAEREAAERAAAKAAALAAAAEVQQSLTKPATKKSSFVSKMWKSVKKALTPEPKAKAAPAQPAAAPVPELVRAEPALSVVLPVEPAAATPVAPAAIKVPAVLTTAVLEEDTSDYATPVTALSSASSLDAASLQTAESAALEQEEPVGSGSMWQRGKAWFTRVNNRRPELTGSVLALALGSLGCFSANVVH